tara:strand:+ start:58 stop:1143 length:1086 start_codon:yes stop_codon:yes gene_type:complete
MKILVILPNFEGGGAERIHINLANEWVKSGNEVIFCVLQKKGPLLSKLHKEIKILDLNCNRILFSLNPLMNAMKKIKPEVIVSAMWPLTTVSVFAKLLSGSQSKTFLVEHIAYEKILAKLLGHSLFLIGLSKTVSYIFAKRVISVSKGVENSIKRITFLPSSKFKVIYNGIPIPKSIENEKKTLFNTNKKVLLSAASFTDRKDFPTLIKALSILFSKGYTDLRLFILGDGPMKGAIENVIKDLKMDKNIELLGFKNDIYKYMASSDLFVHSSKVEGFALVVAEALSCGTNVVSTDSPHGPSEILENGKFGNLVKIGDAEQMANAIIEKILNPLDKEILKKRADKFSIETCAKSYLEEFNKY